MRDDQERLLDILDAIERIEKYSGGGREMFERDELVQVWSVHHVQVIGEAASQLSAQTRDRLPQVPWRAIIAMRNFVVHSYFKVDLDEVWGVIERDIPILKSQIESLLNSGED